MLDTKITTRVLFERERATSLSAATVDIVIENPVLYVAVYKTDCAPRDSQQWTFLIGPSVETAQSEGVRCAVEIHLDSNGWEMWVYNQTVVPLWYEDDLLARIMIAEIRNLAPLGAIMRNEEGTPMTEIATLAGDMALCSFCSNAWVWEKLELLARKPECLERSFNALETLEKAGCRFSVTRRQIAIEELFERFRSKDARKTERTFPAIELKSLNFVDGWEEPSDDEDDLIVSPNVERGQTITTSRFVQVATGVLGAAALETRERVAEWDQYLKWCEQEREAVVEPEGSEIALLSPLRMGFEHENEAVEEDEAQTESEGGVDGDDEDE